MIAFLIRRSIGLVAVLFCVVTITFFLIRLSPGGPFDAERKIPPAIEKQLLAKLQIGRSALAAIRGLSGRSGARRLARLYRSIAIAVSLRSWHRLFPSR